MFFIVWEKQDHMEAADFDPKTFFMMHGKWTIIIIIIIKIDF